MVQTRPDISVYLLASQRHLQEPAKQRAVDLNRVLRYLKLNPQGMIFRKVSSPWMLVAVSDSAYKSDTQDCLAMRSGIIMLMSKQQFGCGDHTVQVIDFVAKKQNRVCRSTYTLQSFTVCHALNVNLALTEILTGVRDVKQLLEAHEGGKHALRLNAVIDAGSVLDSVSGAEVKVPTDQGMLIHALRLHKLLQTQVETLWWVDTRDMLADGLHKGTIDRTPLRQLSNFK